MFENELKVAVEAVLRACKLTTLVSRQMLLGKTSEFSVTKIDKSPVTVADFGAQAIVNAYLQHEYPADSIVGEEDSQQLVASEPSMRKNVLSFVNQCMSTPILIEELLTFIDRGSGEGGAKGRFWTLDPIDGTKGFLRGEQYAVCLALIVEGSVKVAILVCPNLSLPGLTPETGLLFGAVEGQGAFYQCLNDTTRTRVPIRVSSTATSSEACFCESVEAGHSDHGYSATVASRLNITKPPVRMDSQCKYATLASGQADIYMRLPTQKGYEEKIWDHAAGDLIVREAGGHVTDVSGKRLDFSCGKTLKNNLGVMATNGILHAQLLQAWSAAGHSE